MVVIVNGVGIFAPWVYGMVLIFIYWNSAVNIIVYLYYNSVFRGRCLNLFGLERVCGSATEAHSEQSATA